MDIHIFAISGDLIKIKSILLSAKNKKKLVNSYDDNGMTPLMLAIKSPATTLELITFLIEAGANVNKVSNGFMGDHRSVLSIALGVGNPTIVELLLERGADIHYNRNEYDALLDAVHGRSIAKDNNLIPLLKLIIAHGAPLQGVTEYCESGIRVVSHYGRFDAVKLLLDSGADSSQLSWTPLMKAIALGTNKEVKTLLESGSSLESTDSWKRTPWLLAIQTGSISKAKLLLQYGANQNALGNVGSPSLFYSIGNGHEEMLEWLLTLDMDIEQPNEHGTTILMEAAERGDISAVKVLLKNGAKVDKEEDEQTALSYANTADVASELLAAGADPAQLNSESKRALLGLQPEESDEYRLVTTNDFKKGRYHRYGKSNPENINEPFWEAMIRSGVSSWHATQAFSKYMNKPEKPVWTADRFGQSITFLSDGRIVLIGGEHEDYYDPDFFIYNDVFVLDRKNNITIYGYPKEIFPPTDFHTATLVGNDIYLIGSLGYMDTRQYNKTPVFRLSLNDFHIEALKTTGDNPGRIYKHQASLDSKNKIVISGGNLMIIKDNEEQVVSNSKKYLLDLKSLKWSQNNID